MSFNLLAARMNQGLSSRAAADKMNISPAVLLGAENGTRPQLRHAKAIADFYGVLVTDIWPVEDDTTEAAA